MLYENKLDKVAKADPDFSKDVYVILKFRIIRYYSNKFFLMPLPCCLH